MKKIRIALFHKTVTVHDAVVYPSGKMEPEGKTSGSQSFKLFFLLFAFVLFWGILKAQTTVTYAMQDAYFPTQFNDGGDFFNNGSIELGMWANTGNKNTVAWRTLKTGGDNTGSNRSLQVGDVFKITVAATRAYGQIGFSLNAGGTQGNNYDNRVSGSRLYFNTDLYGAWYVNRSGGNQVLGYGYIPIQDTYKDYIFTVKITSTTTADVYLSVEGTDFRAYNLTMNGTTNIDAFSIYGSDLWDGNSSENAYWKQTSTVTNSKIVELGYFLTTGVYTPGLISDGLDAGSNSVSSKNDIYIGGDAGSSVVLNQANSYTGSTTINANATLKLGASGVIPDASALKVTGTLDLAGYSESIGSLAGTGSVTSSAAGTPMLTAGGDNSSTAFSGVIQNGSATTVSLTKTGSGTLTLSGTNTYTGNTIVSGGTLSTSKSLASSTISVANTATFSATDNISVNSLTLENGSTLNIASGKKLTINGTLTLSGTVIINGGGTIAYGPYGILTYNGTNFTTTTDTEFPETAGPKDLNITIANGSGISLHANRTIGGKMTITSGQKFIIPSGISLTVTGTLTNSAGTTGLVVKSGGSLIQNSAVSATVERDIAAWNNPTIDHGWHFLSSPVSAQTIAPNFTNATATNYDFYCWWEPTNQWVNFKNTTVAPTWNTANNSSANFLAGICYLVDYAATSTKQFTGTLNKDDLSMGGLTISTGANKGWHLLGNPFTSAIKWNDGHWTLNNIAAGAKIWSETNASYSDIAANGIIPALNGFMVQVTSGTGSLTIPIAARVHNTTAWYKSTESPFIVLVAHDLSGQTAQESVVRFDNQATTGFDSDFDSHFLAGYAPQFYSIAGEDQLSTNVLPEIGGTVQIPFSFIKNDGASFSIEAKTISDLFGPVLLNDLKTKATQDLTSNPVYSFTAEPGDNPNRFLLTFSHLGIGETSKDHPFNVFASGHSLFISDNTGKNQGNVYVYNMMGQPIASSELNGNATIKLNLNVPAGYYLVKVVTSDQAYSNKVFINQ